MLSRHPLLYATLDSISEYAGKNNGIAKKIE
jgi:hypothetical protein